MKSKTKKKTTKGQNLRNICGIAIFSALAFGVSLVFRIPVGFLTFDAKDAIITIAAFIWGPLSAIPMALIAALLELVTISSTGWYGFLMNISSTLAFSMTAALIYKIRRTRNGSIIAIYSAVLALMCVMMLMNLLITPLYMGVPRGVVMELIPTLLLPFNFAKAMLNGAIVVILYKPAVTALRFVGFAKASPKGGKLRLDKNSVIMLILGTVTLTVAVIFFVILRLNFNS